MRRLFESTSYRIGRHLLVAASGFGLLIAASAVARADVITTYTISDFVLGTGGTVTGSFQVDDSTFDDNVGYVAGSSTIAVSGVGGSEAFVNGSYSFGGFSGNEATFISGGTTLFLIIGNPPVESGSISEVLQTFYNFSQSAIVDIFAGYLVTSTVASTPASVPEPSSFFLLATTLAGLGGLRLCQLGLRRSRNSGTISVTV